MTGMLVIDDDIRIPKDELHFSFARSQGPGGQNVNKVNSKATLRWDVKANTSIPPAVKQRFLIRFKSRLSGDGELILSSQRYRDQPRNKADCLDRLRALVDSVKRPPKRRKLTKPTKGSKLKRRKNKQANAQKKQLRRPPRLDS